MTNTESSLKRHHFADKGLHSQSYGFSCSHVRMWNLDHKEGWTRKNWCFWTVVLEKTLWSPLYSKEIKPVNPKGNQPWIFIGRTDAEAETPILQPRDAKNWLTGKDPDARKDWRQEEKGTKEDEMVGWHYRLDGHEFEQALGVGDGQGSLACCSPWGHKESDMTEQLNWTKLVQWQLTGKDPNAGKDLWQEEKGATENETAGWHHRLNGHESEQTLGDSEGQGSLSGMPQSMQLQRAGHHWATEQQQAYKTHCCGWRRA